MKILRAIFGVTLPVSQKLYVVVGFGLMGLKYLTESGLVYATTQTFYPPHAFLIPSFALRENYLVDAPGWLHLFLIAWSIPFVWIACTMSVRRAIDGGVSPWNGFLVLVPIINLLAMVVLAVLPSTKPVNKEARHDESARPELMKENAADGGNALATVYSVFLGLLVGGIFAVATTVLSVYSLDSYGGSLFMGMPIVTGMVSGFVFNQPDMRGALGSTGVGALAVIIGGAGLLLFALEGVICLVMAAPLIVPLGALGGWLGWALAKTILIQSRWMLGGALLVVPFLTMVERHLIEYREHMVQSEVVIHASPETVWTNVISFPDIDSSPAWYFRLGVASPQRARIEGQGIGAVRHCEFTTGSFVEPITAWVPGKRLAFDVTKQPDPLIELTPYRDIRPPHLQHSFRSSRGEFELVDLGNGQTRLIGRTWYYLEMGPRLYWKIWTDEIIHRIHLRVLEHIATQCQRN